MVLNIFLYLLISSNTRTGLRTARGRGKTPIPPAGRRRETATPREESPDRNDGQRDVAPPEAARAIQPRAPALAPGIPPASDSHFPTTVRRGIASPCGIPRSRIMPDSPSHRIDLVDGMRSVVYLFRIFPFAFVWGWGWGDFRCTSNDPMPMPMPPPLPHRGGGSEITRKGRRESDDTLIADH